MTVENRCAEYKYLFELCENIRTLMMKDEYEESRRLICSAMSQYPDSAQPHNLMGILLEKLSDPAGAMKHFRAAWALDPTYVPARQNMERVGTFDPDMKVAFNERDCRVKERRPWFKIEYDENGVGRMVKR